jgi:hypothetical protein
MLTANCINGETEVLAPESIERFIEDQAFSPSYHLDQPPPLLASKSVSLLSLPVCRLLADRGEGVGEELNHMTARKLGPS